MEKKIIIIITILLLVVGGYLFINKDAEMTGAPPYGESEQEIPRFGTLSWLENWKRAEGPAKVALQVGHWKNDELPEELHRLKGNTGSSGGGKTESQVNLAIAKNAAELLEKEGITVDILPATVPLSYWADVFVAIHADGSIDSSKSGYKIASPWRDITGNADNLVGFMEKSYEASTKLTKDPNISRNMRGYYAFSWWRYSHAIHPMTAAAIIETGFLTNSTDRKLLIGNPGVAAQAIADGIIDYLESEELLDR